MRRRLLCLLLAALLLTATGCANWEEPSDPAGRAVGVLRRGE